MQCFDVIACHRSFPKGSSNSPHKYAVIKDFLILRNQCGQTSWHAISYGFLLSQKDKTTLFPCLDFNKPMGVFVLIGETLFPDTVSRLPSNPQAQACQRQMNFETVPLPSANIIPPMPTNVVKSSYGSIPPSNCQQRNTRNISGQIRTTFSQGRRWTKNNC